MDSLKCVKKIDGPTDIGTQIPFQNSGNIRGHNVNGMYYNDAIYYSIALFMMLWFTVIKILISHDFSCSFYGENFFNKRQIS